ncbi:hypothetical protein M0802_016898 [Mischocyttarus mexicanus]|nr:hypothetical protein M0802_016898 [Mischocyttarus mexicanus]
MRSMKTKGGLTRGRGITDEVLTKWVLTMPVFTAICNYMHTFCNVNVVTSEQSVDSRGSSADVTKLQEFFYKFDLFLSGDKVVSIFTANWGWKIEDSALKPTLTNNGLVPQTLLLDIKCKCAVKWGKTCESLLQTD